MFAPCGLAATLNVAQRAEHRACADRHVESPKLTLMFMSPQVKIKVKRSTRKLNPVSSIYKLPYDNIPM